MPDRIRHLGTTSLGTSPCEKVLADVLNQHPRCMRKVTHLLHDFRTGLHRLEALSTDQDKDGKRFLYRLTILWFRNNKRTIDQLSLPEEVRIFTHNVLKANWREWLRQRKGKNDE